MPELRIFPRASAGIQIKFKISSLLPLRRFGAARHSLPVEKHTTFLLPLTILLAYKASAPMVRMNRGMPLSSPDQPAIHWKDCRDGQD